MNNKTPTDTQLKQALAKMLPNDVTLYDGMLLWPIRDTELLHLCWLTEKAISDIELYRSWHDMLSHTGGLSATWQQRTMALAKVLGVKIV